MCGIEQQDRERLVVDDLQRGGGEPLEQQVDVEDGRDLAADFEQRLEDPGILGRLGVQARVLERGGGVDAELADDRQILLGERVPMRAEDVERADGPRAVDERHDDGRVHAGHVPLVVGVEVEVVDEHGAAILHRQTDESLPHRQPDRLRDAGRVAQRVVHVQPRAGRVQHVDGERVELDQPLDQPGNRLEELLQREHRHDPAPEVEQRSQRVLIADRSRRRGWITG